MLRSGRVDRRLQASSSRNVRKHVVSARDPRHRIACGLARGEARAGAAVLRRSWRRRFAQLPCSGEDGRALVIETKKRSRSVEVSMERRVFGRACRRGGRGPTIASADPVARIRSVTRLGKGRLRIFCERCRNNILATRRAVH